MSPTSTNLVNAAELPVAAAYIERNIPSFHAAMPVMQCVELIELKFHAATDTGNSLPLNVSVGVVKAMSAHGTARRMK